MYPNHFDPYRMERPMKLLRTPNSRFDNLPDYPFEPHYVELDGLRLHYVDEGPADAVGRIFTGI